MERDQLQLLDSMARCMEVSREEALRRGVGLLALAADVFFGDAQLIKTGEMTTSAIVPV
jgi:hypothetical protein